MLVAASSLGLQNLLLDITSTGIFNVALTIGALLVLAAAWSPGEAAGRWSDLSRRILLGVVFVRFAIPVLVIFSTLVFDVFLAAEQAASIEALEGMQAKIEEINEQPAPVPDPDESVVDRLGALLDRSLDSIDFSDRLERLQAQVSQASEHVVNLIVIFVLQTILIPIAFIWLFVEALKGIGRRLTRN